MSGPVTAEDATADAGCGVPAAPEVELLPAREAEVGGLAVRRALPRRARRTVGPWCFADHVGPASPPASMQVGPHPHIGLHTVTWLVEGEVLHRDSLGSEQLVRPGQLNLMTAGHGVSHSEEQPTGVEAGPLHGIQLWVAQPEATRHGPPAFEHHAELPQVDLGDGHATVFVGTLAGQRSPARADTPLLGVDVEMPVGGSVALPLHPVYEHALVVLSGSVAVEGTAVAPGVLAYLGEGRDDVTLVSEAETRVVVLGGEPFREQIVMAWNFVARDRAELDAAAVEWNAGDARFGTVASALERIPAPTPGVG